jgi:hypothetical protein
MGGRQNLDALRANRLRQQGLEEPEERGGFTVGKAFMIILLMLALGAGSAYAYFKISTPTVHSNGPATTTPSVSGTTPTANPSSTGTPKSFITSGDHQY